MPDNPALLSTALLGQYRDQTRRLRPEDRMAKVGAALAEQGSAITPVQSPLEGLARALQGGLGGLVEYKAYQRGEERDAKTQSKLGRMLQAKNSDELRAIAEEPGGDAETLSPILGQLLVQKMADERTLTQAVRGANAVGAGGSPVPSGPAPQQQQFQVGPLPASVSAAPQSANVQQAMQFFTQDPELQLQPHQAAALVGRLYGESGVNPGAVKLRDSATGGPSVGISQWNDERLARLRQMAPGADLNQIPLATQLQFAKSELLGPERASLEALRKAQSVNEAAPAAVGFFRPKDTQGAIAQATTAGNVIYGAPTPEQIAANPGGAAVPPTQIAQGGDSQVAPGAPQPPQMAQATNAPPSAYDAGAIHEQAAARAAASGTPEGLQIAKELQLKAMEERAKFQAQQVTEAEKQRMETERMRERTQLETGSNVAIKTLEDYNKVARPAALAAVTDINAIHQMRQLIDQGVFSGAFAPQGEVASRLAQQLGINLGPDAQANTAALRAAAGTRMGAIIKQYGSGTGISDADIRAATARIGGDTTQGEEAIRKVLDQGEREARRGLSAHATEVRRLRSVPGLPTNNEYYALPDAPTYEEWSKANAPIRPPQQGAQQSGPRQAPQPGSVLGTTDKGLTIIMGPDGKPYVRQ